MGCGEGIPCKAGVPSLREAKKFLIEFYGKQ